MIAHRLPRSLAAARLYRRVPASQLPFRSTAEVEPLSETLGQPRAVESLTLGLDLAAPGYNLFVVGATGTGRETTVRNTIEQLAPNRPQPDDWVYVRDFDDRDRARALRLPAGRGEQLAAKVGTFLGDAVRQIRAALESEQYADRGRAVASDAAARRDAVVDRVQRFAAERSFRVELTMTGLASMPVINGQPIDAEQYRQLSETQRQTLDRHSRETQEEIGEAVVQIRAIEKQVVAQLRDLEREVATFAIAPLVSELEAEFADLSEVAAYIRALTEDVLQHVAEVHGAEPNQAPPQIASMLGGGGDGLAERDGVNVLVAHRTADGAPIVVERHPTYYNLIGRIDYRTAFGTLVTDFRQIKAGALHRANGGFLILHAKDVLGSPFAWDALKSALTSREIRIENLASQYSAVPTVTLQPEPIPLDVKVVIIGSPRIYELLSQLDEDFRELFKMRVDFSPDMDWNDTTAMGYAQLISRVVRETGALHFDRAAVARVIEYGARLEDDQRKLTARLSEIADLVTESAHGAARAGRRVVGRRDVARTIEQRAYRANMVEERLREVVARGILRVETQGSRVGQVNGVAVLDAAGHRFGEPCRITATVAPGAGVVRSIEQESHLSGKLHSKGVLTLSGYLAHTYARDVPLAVAARIGFEQSYDEVDGDSASCAELCALLSALADTEIRQDIAVTGSVDQHGWLQAVGGVTTKIEGFFDVCAQGGLTGTQGMVIPQSNVETLMLKDEVREAVRRRRFHVWAATSVDEVLALLTGMRAGARSRDGKFAPGTIHRAIEDRLGEFAKVANRVSAPDLAAVEPGPAEAAGTQRPRSAPPRASK